MRYNGIIDHEIVADLETEPVTLDELKAHLNMLFDTDGSYEFNDDDTLLDGILSAARQSMEEYTGLSFGIKTIRVLLRNDLGGVEIPYGPVRTISAFKDKDGNAISDYKLIGISSKRVESPCCGFVDVTYEAGYETLPAALKRAVLHEAAFRYQHRGEDPSVLGYCSSAMELAAPFKRTSCLV